MTKGRWPRRLKRLLAMTSCFSAYGAIYAKSIEVHQDTKVIWVPFLRETVNAVIAGVYN